MAAPLPETEIARPVVAYLRDQQWDVHQEVALGARADIVGVHPRPSGLALLWVIEVKRSLTFEVIAQARNWLDHAHYVSVAVPATHRSSDGRRIAERCLASYGIGLIEVDMRYVRAGGEGSVRVCSAPTIGRRRLIPQFVARLRGALCDETRTYAEAGNAESRFWSPFRNTCHQIVQEIQKRGPLTTRELVAAITHHYRSDATARSTLPHWLLAGKIPGVESDSGRPMRWRLKAPEARAA